MPTTDLESYLRYQGEIAELLENAVERIHQRPGMDVREAIRSFEKWEATAPAISAVERVAGDLPAWARREQGIAATLRAQSSAGEWEPPAEPVEIPLTAAQLEVASRRTSASFRHAVSTMAAQATFALDVLEMARSSFHNVPEWSLWAQQSPLEPAFAGAVGLISSALETTRCQLGGDLVWLTSEHRDDSDVGTRAQAVLDARNGSPAELRAALGRFLGSVLEATTGAGAAHWAAVLQDLRDGEQIPGALDSLLAQFSAPNPVPAARVQAGRHFRCVQTVMNAAAPYPYRAISLYLEAAADAQTGTAEQHWAAILDARMRDGESTAAVDALLTAAQAAARHDIKRLESMAVAPTARRAMAVARRFDGRGTAGVG